MSSFVMACMVAYSMLPWHHPDARPQRVCEAIEFFADAQAIDPYVLGGIAWHESTWVPGLVSPDREDYGSMQVRVRQATGNRWVNKLGGQVCTREHVKTVWGGVECGTWVYVNWRTMFPKLHPTPRWPRRSVLGCYATGMGCHHGAGARGIEELAEELRRIARHNPITQECVEL